MVVGKTQAKDFEDCRETDPNEFFSLINAPVQSYIPPLDRNGNTILSENDVFIQKSRHYFAELNEFPEVTIFFIVPAPTTGQRQKCEYLKAS